LAYIDARHDLKLSALEGSFLRKHIFTLIWCLVLKTETQIRARLTEIQKELKRMLDEDDPAGGDELAAQEETLKWVLS